MTEEGKRKKSPPPNSIRFPKEVLEYFGKGTPGWQTRISKVLLDYVRENGGG